MKIARLFFSIIMLLIVFDSCKRDAEITIPQHDYSINLRWNQAYENETKENVETGLLWVFSFLGADIPKGSFNQAKTWGNNILKIDLSKVGFNPIALNAFSKLLPQLKQSEEYQKINAIDIGRFIMLTLNSSNHYYAITGASNNFLPVKANHFFDSVSVAITQSTITLTNRLIEVPDSNVKAILNLVFIANECDGSVANGTQIVYEHEVAELMPNGQFRFSIYDVQNNLLEVSNTAKTNSGKPSKCLWCHEINIQTFHTIQTDVPGYYGADMFKHVVSSNTLTLNSYRNTLKSDIDFSKTQDHTFAELLYISFMEPSSLRLAIEWNMGESEVKNLLIGIPTHINAEFNFLGTLYDRKDIDSFAPYKGIKVPDSAREYSPYEPNLIK